MDVDANVGLDVGHSEQLYCKNPFVSETICYTERDQKGPHIDKCTDAEIVSDNPFDLISL